MRHAQGQLRSGAWAHDVIFYTEADQVLYVDHMHVGVLVALLSRPGPNRTRIYVAPNRLEEVYKGHGASRGPTVQRGNRTFVVCNACFAGGRKREKRLQSQSHALSGKAAAGLKHKLIRRLPCGSQSRS